MYQSEAHNWFEKETRTSSSFGGSTTTFVLLRCIFTHITPIFVFLPRLPPFTPIEWEPVGCRWARSNGALENTVSSIYFEQAATIREAKNNLSKKNG